jgi:predicted O-methyltransferase YrrM
MLKIRALTEEQMDDPAISAAVYAQVLGDLARANTVTMARRPTLNFLRRLPQTSQPLRVLDVGFAMGICCAAYPNGPSGIKSLYP